MESFPPPKATVAPFQMPRWASVNTSPGSGSP